MDDLRELKQYSERIATPDDEELREMRQRIVDTITNAEHGDRRWLHRVRGRVVVPVLAGVLTVGLVLAVTLVRDASNPGSTDSVLLQAANTLEDQSGAMTVPNANQWRYVNEFYRNYWHDNSNERESWMRADYARYAEYKKNGTLDTQTNNGQPYEETEEFSTMGELATFLRDLPDDPDATLERIYAIADEHDIRVPLACISPKLCEEIWNNEPWARDSGAYQVLHDLLRISVPSPAVQAKLFRALDRIPGTYDVGTIRDATDNEVHVIGWKPPDSFENTPDLTWTENLQILIDTDTHTYRGYRFVDLFFKGDVKDGVMSQQIYLDRAIVNQPGQRP